MAPENKTIKKENWFSRLSRNLFKKTSGENLLSESQKESPKNGNPNSEPQKISAIPTQDFIQQKLLGELTKLKVNLESEIKKTSINEIKPKEKPEVLPKEDEFDINRFNRPYNGLNIVSPAIKPHATESGHYKPIPVKISSSNNDEAQQQNVLEMRKKFLKELVRLKQVVNETEVESEEDKQEQNLLNKKLLDELSQFKKSIKGAPTEEEKKILSDGEWDVW